MPRPLNDNFASSGAAVASVLVFYAVVDLCCIGLQDQTTLAVARIRAVVDISFHALAQSHAYACGASGCGAASRGTPRYGAALSNPYMRLVAGHACKHVCMCRTYRFAMSWAWPQGNISRTLHLHLLYKSEAFRAQRRPSRSSGSGRSSPCPGFAACRIARRATGTAGGSPRPP